MTEAVRIVPYDPAWPARFAEEEERIYAALGGLVFAVRHIGSTAVPGLPAKPIIDILAGLPALENVPAAVPRLESLGYEYLGEYGIPERHYFRRPPGPAATRLFHVHMVQVGSPFWADHLLFRNYLRRHPEEAARYAALKQDLAARHGKDRDAYTADKTDFVQGTLERARAELEAGIGAEIQLSDWDPAWPATFAAESAAVRQALGPLAVAIEHVGSTAIEGLGAKPTIDIQLGLASLSTIGDVARLLEPLGYAHRGEQGVAGRHLFIKPADEMAPRLFHLHACEVGSEPWLRTIAFRDYLRSHPEAASKYVALKRELGRRYPADRDSYTFAKTSFIEEILRKALPAG
jgi:GrpB-like predicted nucleotidyltransferase (UPF0157 family)